MRNPARVAWPRRALAALAPLALLAACRSYVFPAVDVAYERVSPPYVVTLVNDTGSSFAVLPSASGARAGRGAVLVAPRASFTAILQLRRFGGAGGPTSGAQVVEGPYFEQAPAGQARLELVQIRRHALLIDLSDASWFEAYRRPDAAPLELRVALAELPQRALFPSGPRAGP